jgi:hypothetical protein
MITIIETVHYHEDTKRQFRQIITYLFGVVLIKKIIFDSPAKHTKCSFGKQLLHKILNQENS